MSYVPQLVGKTYHVRTFGCQMNLHDSERVAGLLDDCGCVQVSDVSEADIVVFMTCSVREKADTHLYGEASNLVRLPKPPCGRRIVAIGGCIAQRDGETLKKKIPNVDVVFGTSALASVPQLLVDAFEDGDDGEVFVDTVEEGRGFSTELPSHREQQFHAWVPIMTGCNNFCTYCIVPYVRGREKSRVFERIVDECRRLVDDGVREVTLLGQNVNSYGKDLYGELRFAELLRAVGETGVERIRFTSSNPKDLSPEIINAMAEVSNVMPHLHLAVQSGSSRVLKAMNRSYTREQYIDLAKRIKTAVPGIALTTDIIVGFPVRVHVHILQAPGYSCREDRGRHPARGHSGALRKACSARRGPCSRGEPGRPEHDGNVACGGNVEARQLGARGPQPEEPNRPVRPSRGQAGGGLHRQDVRCPGGSREDVVPAG